MFKLFIYYLIINIINVCEIESCSSSSQPECPKYVYKNYQERQHVISNLPNKRRLGHLSLVGTYQSMTYRSTDFNIKTQDLSVTDQLKSGIRVLDVTVRLEDKFLSLYSKGKPLNFTLFHILYEIEQFLYFYSREFVILIINYDISDPEDMENVNSNMCNKIDQYHYSVGGWRLVNNWKLTDTVEKHRGKILLATYDSLFSQCLYWFRSQCSYSNDVAIRFESNKIFDEDDYKYDQYVSLQANCHSYGSACFIYNMGIYVFHQNYNIQVLSKFGGYFNKLNNKCIEPINYKIANTNQTSCLLALNIYILNYVTQEIIDNIDNNNHDLIHYKFDN